MGIIKSFGGLFTASQCGENGTAGCIQSGGTCNTDAASYFSYNDTSMTMIVGNDCRTVSTADEAMFSLGDGGVTQISFDFEISDNCHAPETGIAWLAFWIYSKPWKNTLEVDFIESKFGPSNGLNTNFAGAPGTHQVQIFDTEASWKGSIVAKFTTNGNSVNVEVTNSNNSNVAKATLSGKDGYFFVMDTATGSTAEGGTFTISNLSVEGKFAVRD
ncbi:MAG: hypothetical protein COA38_03735 [Fluviicola sp.]|nr:MAG: hypothetical protein COA38_03735 [Fluviicola sp.]